MVQNIAYGKSIRKQSKVIQTVDRNLIVPIHTNTLYTTHKNTHKHTDTYSRSMNFDHSTTTSTTEIKHRENKNLKYYNKRHMKYIIHFLAAILKKKMLLLTLKSRFL